MSESHAPATWKHSRRWLGLWYMCLSWVLLWTSPVARAGNSPSLHTTIREIRLLTPAQADEKRLVVVSGIVSALSGWKDSFFLQDATGGISVNRLDHFPSVHPGDRIVLTGNTIAGAFIPSIEAHHVEVSGNGKRPRARVYRGDEISYGAQDSQLIALRGIIRSADVRSVWERDVLTASLDIGDGVLVALRVHDFAPTDAAGLPGARVTVFGVCGTVFDERRQFLGARLFVASTGDIHVDKRAPSHPFAEAPFRRIDDLLRFSGSASPLGEIRTSGVVTWTNQRSGFFLQDDSHGVFVRDREAASVKVGMTVDVVGSPTLENGAPVLKGTNVRESPVQRRVQPVSVAADQLLIDRDGFVYALQESVLIRVRGKLVESFTSASGDTLLLESGKTVFSARVPRSSVPRHWEVGSQLSLTGVCEVSRDEAHEPTSIQLQMRDPDDVIVLRGPPWWTAGHALWIVFMLLLLVVAMLGWVGFLRWQTMLKTQATTDSLTGLYNRRCFLELAQRRRDAAKDAGKEFQLIFIDIDSFKQMNDTFGHREGDNALRAVAAMLQKMFRNGDVIGRLGGDEFAIATSGASGPHLRTRLEKAVAAMNADESRAFPVSLSMGVLECNADMQSASMEELLEKADLLMYEQKRASKAGLDMGNQMLAAV